MSAIRVQRNVAKLFTRKPGPTSQAQYSASAVLEIKPYDLFRLEAGPSTRVTVTKVEAVELYTKMQRIRRMEAVAATLYREKLIRGFCHLYSGQEAVAVGITTAMRPQDRAISGYRVHGWVNLMGVPVAKVLSELTGRRTGCCRGKGGSMHLYGGNFFGGNGIVGAQVSLGAGLALASRYSGDGGVAFAVYGDGAANQGQVFETFNMAKLWSLPCVFVCENNGYGMGTSMERSSASTAYYTRGDYIPGIKVDGMDVLSVRESAKFAIDHASSGRGPIVLEMVTYRYSGHSMSDPGTSYRSREEVSEFRSKKDPITSFKEKMAAAGLLTESEVKAIDAAVKEEVARAQAEAVSEPEIGSEELTADVYARPLEPFARNVLPRDELKLIRVSTGKEE